MNIYLLIARRFLFPRNGFRSNTINFISFVGLFIGAASIVLSISVLNGFQGILQNEAKKLYGDYLVEDLQNLNFKNTSQDLNIDKMSLSIFQEDEFLIIAQNKQNIIEFKSVSNESLNSFYDLNLQNNFKNLFVGFPINSRAIISKTSGTDAVCAKKTIPRMRSGFNAVDMFSIMYV